MFAVAALLIELDEAWGQSLLKLSEKVAKLVMNLLICWLWKLTTEYN